MFFNEEWVLKRGCTRKSTIDVALGSTDFREIRTRCGYWAKNSAREIFLKFSSEKFDFRALFPGNFPDFPKLPIAF